MPNSKKQNGHLDRSFFFFTRGIPPHNNNNKNKLINYIGKIIIYSSVVGPTHFNAHSPIKPLSIGARARRVKVHAAATTPIYAHDTYLYMQMHVPCFSCLHSARTALHRQTSISAAAVTSKPRNAHSALK